MNPSFWHGKRVFITGHTGFKGSWISLWLQQLGAEVTGYALTPPTNPNIFELANVSYGMTTIYGDVREGSFLADALANAAPQIVIHMAAQPLVRHSYIDPVETYSTNVMGTVHLLEAVRRCSSIRAVVNVTTDKCYENKEWVWAYRENEPLGGYDPYSNSKGCSELVTAAFRSSFFNPDKYAQHRVGIATARAGNVIGGGDWAANRLIPDILTAFADGKPVAIRNPSAIRPWQHVLEPLRGYLTLAERLYTDGILFGGSYNFGPRGDDARSVEWIVRKLSEYWGKGSSWSIETVEQPHEANLLKLDISKAAHFLGWSPVLDLEQSLQLIVDWNKGLERGDDPKLMTISQILNYQRSVLETLNPT